MTAREANKEVGMEMVGVTEEEFISDNIKQLECSGYTKREENEKETILRRERKMQDKNQDYCHCGRLKSSHESEKPYSDLTANTWKAKQVPCNCFGEITFDGYGKKANKAKYLRLNRETKPKLVWTLLTEHWNVPPPKCVLSIMAGFEHYTHSSELKTILKQRLMKAVQATEAWIITGGRANGLTGILGTSVQDCTVLSRDKSTQSQPVLLGIPHWCFTENTSALEGAKTDTPHQHQATYSKNSTKTTRALDHNHTHFLLADDGRNDELCSENHLRINLEKYIRKDKGIPSVTIIMSGARTTTETLTLLLEKRIPVVVVEGSGYYADFLAYAFKITEREGETSRVGDGKTDIESERIKENFKSSMKRKAEKVFGKIDELNDLKLDELKECLTGDQRKLLHIFELNNTDSEQDLDRVIVNALLKASDKFDVKKKLELAQAWNRFDFVQEEIFTPSNEVQPEDLHLPMIMALVNDQPEFVKLFIDEGLNINAQFKIEDLGTLYSECLAQGSEESNLIHRLLKRACCVDPDIEKSSNPGNDQEIPQEKNVDNERTPLKKSKEKRNELDLKHIGAMISHLLRDARFNVYSGSSDDTDKNRKGLFEDLLIWATLFNRTRMVNLFWMKGQDHIKWALFSAALSKSLSKVALQKKKEKLSHTYRRNSLFYEKCASTVLSKSDDIDKHRNRHWTPLLLVREITFATKRGSNPDELYGTSALMMAESYKPIIFTGEPVCQATLNSIWKGRMAPLTPLWLIVLCIIFPPFTIFVEFTGQNTVSDHNHELRKVQPSLCCGDNNRGENNSSHSDEVNCLEAFRLLFNAPVSKFICNLVAYLVFLTTFSYHLLVELDAASEPSVLEYIIYVWILTMMIEEARQMYARKSPLFQHKLLNWFGNKWNILDILMYSLFLSSIFMRFFLDSYFKWVTVVYSLTLILFFMRLMQYFYSNEYLGPWVIIVGQMFFDMLAFTLLLLVFVVSFGIAYHANMYPHSPPSWSILGDVLYLPYFQIYGHISLEHLDESRDGCTVNETIWRHNPELRCSSENVVVPILMALYVMLTMILLTNLLIAMFSDTISKKRDESTRVWKYYWMSFVYEYSERPTLVPPFIILNHFFRFINYFLRKHQNDDPFIVKMMESEDDERLTQFERICMEHSQVKLKQLLRDFEVETAEKDPDTEEQEYEQMKRKMKRLKEQIDQISNALALRHDQV